MLRHFFVSILVLFTLNNLVYLIPYEMHFFKAHIHTYILQINFYTKKESQNDFLYFSEIYKTYLYFLTVLGWIELFKRGFALWGLKMISYFLTSYTFHKKERTFLQSFFAIKV